MAKTKMTTKTQESTHKQTIHRRWLFASLATAVLSLVACADKAPEISEPDPMETLDDAQTPVEQAANGVASADTSNDPLVNDNVAVATDDMANDDVVLASDDEGVVVEGVDDSEILDGNEQVEHVSTY